MHAPYSYNYLLVAASAGLAFLASVVAFTVLFRSEQENSRQIFVRTAAGGATLGAGIWSMHYSGLLSMHLLEPVYYNGSTTLLALMFGICASCLGLYAAAFGLGGKGRPLIAGLFIALAICSVHYTGMLSMEMPYRLAFEPMQTSLTFLLAWGTAWWSVRTAIRRRTGRAWAGIPSHILFSSFLMAGTVCGTHYTSMGATGFIPDASAAGNLTGLHMDHQTLGYAVGALATLWAAVLAAYLVYNIRREAYKSKLREHHYKSLYEQHPQAVYTLDLQGRCTGMNPAFEAFTGYSSAELLSLPIMAVAARGSLNQLAGQVDQASSGISQSGEIEWRRKDGRSAYSVVTHIPILMDGRAVGIYGFVHDVTGLRQAVEARDRMAGELKKSNDRLMRIQHIAGMGVWDTDLLTGEIHWSPETYRIFQLAPDSPVHVRNFRRFLHPEDREMFEQHIESAKSGGTFRCEFRIIRTDKEVRTLLSQGEVLFDEIGQGYRMWGLVLDITERIKTEAMLRKSDRLFIVSQMAAGVAHEIRNPLTSIKGFLQLMKPNVNELHYRVMMSEMERIEQIIREFLLIAKPQPLETFRFNSLGGILEHVISLLNTQAVMNNIWIAYEPDGDIPAVWCNENQLKQVFINIVQNAIEAMPGGGEIRIRTGMYENGDIKVSILDHGVGIPAERIKRLGEPYFTSKEKGTGLGLTICQRIIEAHGGKMSILSELHQGTEVILIFSQEHESMKASGD